MAKRLYYLDNLRAFTVMLVILHHTAITYGASGSWYYNEVTGFSITSLVLTLFCAIDQSFFMGLLFFISGYFFPQSYDRKGPLLFMRDKLIRLGTPLIFYVFVLGPVLVYLLYYLDNTPFTEYYRTRILTMRDFNNGPLWFVEALLIFSACYTVLRLLKQSRNKPWKPAFPSSPVILGAALLIGTAAFALRLRWPTGTNVIGMQLGYFASYVLLFIAGILAYRGEWLERIPASAVRLWSWVTVGAIISLPIFVFLGGALSGGGDVSSFTGGMTPQSFTVAMWEPFSAFGIILFLITFFRRRFDCGGPFARGIGESSYTAYIIHAPVVVGVCLLIRDVTIPPAFKFVLAGTAGIMVSFGLSCLITRIPGTRRVL